MTVTECPHCQTRFQVPETFLGKRTICKNCGSKFRVEDASVALQRAQEPPVVPAGAPSDDQTGTYEIVAAGGNAETHDASLRDDEFQHPSGGDSTPVGGAPRFANQHAADADDDAQRNRYRNLLNYLEWGRVLAKVGLALCVGVAIVVFLVLAVSSVLNGLTIDSIKSITFAGIGLAWGCLVCYVGFVAFMAAIEFMYVILDIEKNTRNRR